MILKKKKEVVKSEDDLTFREIWDTLSAIDVSEYTDSNGNKRYNTSIIIPRMGIMKMLGGKQGSKPTIPLNKSMMISLAIYHFSFKSFPLVM